MGARQSAVPSVPIYTGVAAEVRLQQLGMPGSQPLVDALHDGASAARATTSEHPAAYAGQRMWGETVASLRRHLAHQGWTAETFKNVDLVVGPKQDVALVVTAGNPAAGNYGYSPQVRYERREVIQSLVNGPAFTLWGPSEPPKWQMWFLLHHLTGRTLDGELSRPTAVGTSGWVAAWNERIMLPQTGFGPAPKRRSQQPPEVEVDVQRRAG